MIKPEDERVPLPPTPKELRSPLPTTTKEAERFNKHMRSIWLKATNLRCENCKRTFKYSCKNHHQSIFCVTRAGAYFKHIKTCLPTPPDEDKDSKDAKAVGDVDKPQLQRKSSKGTATRPPKHRDATALERSSKGSTGEQATSPNTPKRSSGSRRHSCSDKSFKEVHADGGKKADITVEASADSVQVRRTQSFTGRRPKPLERESVTHQLSSHLRLGINEVIQEKKSFKVKTLRPSASFKDSPSNKTPIVAKTESLRRENEIPPKANGQKHDPFRRSALDALSKSVEEYQQKQEARSLKKCRSSKTEDSASTTDLSTKSARMTSRCNSYSHSHRDREGLEKVKPPRRSSLSDRSSSKSAHPSDGPTLDKGMSTSFKQPRGYVCYLCGRSFGSASLAIHMRQCRQLWEDREALKRRKRERRPLPTPPPEIEAPLPTDPNERRAFNDTMLKIWDTKALNLCRHCGRTDEAFEKHQRICTAEHPGGPLGLSKTRRPSDQAELVTSSSKEDDERRPLAYCCYLCGRQYSAASYFLHVPRCRKLWEDREATKPKDRMRPVPPPPPELEGFPDVVLPTDPEEVLAFNNAIYMYWDRVSLYVCPKCGRSFNEESFEKHQKLCGGELKSMQSKKWTHDDEEEVENKLPSMPKAYVCYLCGRQYGSKSLKIHQANCERQWLAEEELKPKSQRRPLPPRPVELDGVLPSDAEGIAEFNAAMMLHWEQHSLIKCPNCERTFKYSPDSKCISETVC